MAHEINHRDTERGGMQGVGNKPSVFPSCHRASVVFVLLAIIVLWFRGGQAHEPITTKVRFNKEVIRILQRSCLGCHKPGGIAMSLATYEEARPWAKAIKEEILEHRMPPWRAVKGYGEFANAPKLTQREIDLMVNWVEGGAPKGDDKDFPAGPIYSNEWPLGKPDLILKPEVASEIAGDADEYRTLTLDANLKEDRWLAAIDLQPGNGAVVHCATLSVEGKQIESWVPGEKRVLLPDDVAWPLKAGSRIAVKIHYRGAGEATKDQSAVGLYFAKTPPHKQAHEIAINNANAMIPVGAEIQRVKASFTMQDDAEAIAIRPAVNPLLVSLQTTAYRPDGTEEVLIWTRGYQFDWRQTYYLKRAIALPKDTRVEVIAYFDNSEANPNNPNEPPKAARWSELSPDPLCALVVAHLRATNDWLNNFK